MRRGRGGRRAEEPKTIIWPNSIQLTLISSPISTENLVRNRVQRTVSANLRCDERADPAKDGAGPDADAPDHGREYLAAAKEDADEDGQGNALTKETTKNNNVNAGTCT